MDFFKLRESAGEFGTDKLKKKYEDQSDRGLLKEPKNEELVRAFRNWKNDRVDENKNVQRIRAELKDLADHYRPVEARRSQWLKTFEDAKSQMTIARHRVEQRQSLFQQKLKTVRAATPK